MGNLALNSAEEPDNLRATTGTVEDPTKTDKAAALALGARPIQHHEPAARHIPHVQIRTFYVKDFESYRLTDRQTDTTKIATVNNISNVPL